MDKVVLRLCFRLLVWPDNLLLVFELGYSDVPSILLWAGGTSAVWLVLFHLFHRIVITTLE